MIPLNHLRSKVRNQNPPPLHVIPLISTVIVMLLFLAVICL
jgi:hypothetical protein